MARQATDLENADLFAHLSHKLGLSQEQAAWRCGISVAAFRWLVEQGLLPKPKNIRKRLVWYRPAVDEAFAGYMNDEQHKEKDEEDEYAV